MDPLSELQDDLNLDDTSQALNQLKLASIDEKNWPSDEMPDFPKSDDSKSSSPEPVTHLKWDDPYYDIARHQIVEVAGDDKYGRKIIVFSACRMPPSHQLDHSKLLGYLKHTLDQYVESDYTLLYLHHGLTSDNKPPSAGSGTPTASLTASTRRILRPCTSCTPPCSSRPCSSSLSPSSASSLGRRSSM